MGGWGSRGVGCCSVVKEVCRFWNKTDCNHHCDSTFCCSGCCVLLVTMQHYWYLMIQHYEAPGWRQTMSGQTCALRDCLNIKKHCIFFLARFELRNSIQVCALHCIVQYMAAPQAVAHQVMCQIKSSWEFCAEAKFVFKDTRAAAQLHAMNKAVC